MKLRHLTLEELLKYLENGLTDSIPADIALELYYYGLSKGRDEEPEL